MSAKADAQKPRQIECQCNGIIYHYSGRQEKPGQCPLCKAAPELLAALLDAQEHLDYCNYGDKWERECAMESKLPGRIIAAIRKATGGDA